MSHAPWTRATDTDREHIARQLEHEVGTGRLDLTDYTTRIDQVYRARTHGELALIVADLPAPQPPAAQRKPWRRPATAAAAATAAFRSPASAHPGYTH